MDAAAIVARLLQYVAVAAVGGSSLFFVYGYRPGDDAAWPRLLVRLSAALGVVAVVGWLMVKAAEFGDGPADAFDMTSVWGVASGAVFGRAALVRAALLIAALGLSLGARPPWRVLAGLGLLASASFAWTGHGNSDEGSAGIIHLIADVGHLLAAAVWVGALFGLAGLLASLSRPAGSGTVDVAADALNAFSRIGVAVVAVILATGLVNSWYLVGLDSIPSLLTTLYGQLLTLKLLLFAGMLGLAALNRYVHTRRVESGDAGALRTVVASVVAETLAGGVVLALVSWLGTLPTPAQG